MVGLKRLIRNRIIQIQEQEKMGVHREILEMIAVIVLILALSKEV